MQQKTLLLLKGAKNVPFQGLNGVVMDRRGLILCENETTGSRKVFRYLLDLRDAIVLSKNVPIPGNPKIQMFTVYFDMVMC